MKKKFFIGFLFIGAITMIAMSYHYLQYVDTGILKSKEVAQSSWYLIIFRTHVLLGLLAITAGPLQFVKSIRRKYKGLHKKLGYAYVACIVGSAPSGLVIAQFAMGGLISTIGFSLLSILWLFTTLKAVVSIQGGNLKQHRKWMLLSYSLTFSAITQRTLLLVPLLTEVSFIPIYQLSAWLPWMLNLYIAHLIYWRASAPIKF